MDTAELVHGRLEHLALIRELAIEEEIDPEVERKVVQKINEFLDKCHKMGDWLAAHYDVNSARMFATPAPCPNGRFIDCPNEDCPNVHVMQTAKDVVNETIANYTSSGAMTTYLNSLTGSPEFFTFYHYLVKERHWVPPISDMDWTTAQHIMDNSEYYDYSNRNIIETMWTQNVGKVHIPKLCLLQSFLRRNGRKEMEEMQYGRRERRSVLYRIQKKYPGWENDFWEGNVLTINRLTSACKPEGYKTFLTPEEYEGADGYREMEVTILVGPRVRCGVDISVMSAYKNYQREILLPAGAQFLITKVEATGYTKPEFRIETKALDPST